MKYQIIRLVTGTVDSDIASCPGDRTPRGLEYQLNAALWNINEAHRLAEGYTRSYGHANRLYLVEEQP